jgi:hypothetical protein
VSGLRYFAGGIGFGFVAIWIMASLAAALVCLSAALVAYCVVTLAERAQARRHAGASPAGTSATAPLAQPPSPSHVENLSRLADALNSDFGYRYEPVVVAAAPSVEAEYGWPSLEGALVADDELSPHPA